MYNYYLAILLLFFTSVTEAQVGIGTSTVNSSAKLQVDATDRGFLPPRMLQAQRDAITSPASGLLIYQTDNTPGFYYFNGSAWARLIVPTDNAANVTGTVAVANGGTGVTTSTGTGSVVLSNSPTLVTPSLGTPSSATLTNATGLPISTGVSGLGTGVATFLGTPSSSNLASAITNETGSGVLVFGTSPTLTTPTISSGSDQWATSLQINPTTYVGSQRASIWIDGWSLLQDVSGNNSKNFSIGQTVPGSPTTFPSRLFIQTNGDIGIGNITPLARLDIRTTPNSTTDPGTGYLGIGTTSTAANSAGAGAIRYNTGNGGVIEYSNGTDWKPLASTKKVAVYTEVHADANNTGTYSAGAAFNDFNSITADNVVDVYGPSYGFFNGTGSGSSSDRWVAPFTGKFRITTNAYFNYNAMYANPRLYAYKNGTTICNITSASSSGQDIATATSAIISMYQGDYINWVVQGSGAQMWRGPYHTFFRIESVE